MDSLEFSRLNEILVDLHMGNELELKIYGDLAYIFSPDTHVLARHNNEPNTVRQNQEIRLYRLVVSTLNGTMVTWGAIGALLTIRKF